MCRWSGNRDVSTTFPYDRHGFVWCDFLFYLQLLSIFDILLKITNSVSICNLEDNPTPANHIYIVYFIYYNIPSIKMLSKFNLKMVTLNLFSRYFWIWSFIEEVTIFELFKQKKNKRDLQRDPKPQNETNKTCGEKDSGKDDARSGHFWCKKNFLTFFSWLLIICQDKTRKN